jgi:hypothetical protein
MAVAPDLRTLSLMEFVRQNPSKRGLAIIISNEYATSSTPLVGPKKDGERMIIAFSRLEIANIWMQNVTKDQLQQLLEEVAQIGPCPETYESISFVFSGHGNNEYLSLEDGAIEIDEVIHAFSPQKAPRIAALPKLFFFDACRGEKIIRPIRVPARRRESSLRTELQPQPRTFVTPKEGNFLIAYSTVAPYSAHDYDDGSEWMKILADTMCKSTDHIEEVLTQVRQDLHKVYQHPSFYRKMQMPESRSTLFQKVYLNRVARQSTRRPTRPVVSRRVAERPSRAYSGSQFHMMYASRSFENSMGAFGQQERLLFRF